MYEPFTDRARKVMLLAHHEAMRLNHGYIGTEHILLGLLKAGGGVGTGALEKLDLKLRSVRFDVENVMELGPDRIARGAKLPQTPRARRVIEHAIEEAHKLKHDYVGTEHLLIGLLRETETVASMVLMSQGARLDEVRQEIAKLLRQGARTLPKPPDFEDLPAELQPIAAELDAEIRRLTTAKHEAIAIQDFEMAASLRDEEVPRQRERRALLRGWIADRLAEPGWLWIDPAVLALARTISDQRNWAALPQFADALERAGCIKADLIDHCRRPPEHSNQCWAIDLLLAGAR